MEIDVTNSAELVKRATDTSLSPSYYFIWLQTPNMIPLFASQNRLQRVDDYFIVNSELAWNDIHR